MPDLQKGEAVIYRPRYMDFDVSAVVRKRHRDGTVTVMARHVLEDGKPMGNYLGYEYRIKPEQLRKDH